MSHFTTIHTRLVEQTHLLKALADMGHTVQQGPVQVRGYFPQTTLADFKIATPSNNRDIGFRRSASGYEILADWWNLKGIKRSEFVRQLHQRYAYHAAREALTAEGFALVEEEQQQDGSLHLVLRRAV